MQVIADTEKWQLCQDRPHIGSPYLILYTLCVKRLLRKPYIVGTDIKIKKGMKLSDTTVRRYGTYVEYLGTFDTYLHESRIWGTNDIFTLLHVSTSPEICSLCKGASLLPKSKFDIKYLFKRLVVAKIKVEPYQWIVRGWISLLDSQRIYLTKGGEILSVEKITEC